MTPRRSPRIVALVLVAAVLFAPGADAASGRAFRVRAFLLGNVADGSAGDRSPGPDGPFWFGVGLYDNPTGFYTPVLRCLETNGVLTSWTLDAPQSFFAASVRRDPATGRLWVLVPRIDADASVLYSLDPGSNAQTRTPVPFRAFSMSLDAAGAPWIAGTGKLARLAGGSFRVFPIAGLGGRISRVDGQGRLWLQRDDDRIAAFSTSSESLDVYADSTEELNSPDVDPSGAVWGWRGAQDRLIRFDPATRVVATYRLVNTASNWARLQATGDQVNLAASYGPHFLSFTPAKGTALSTATLAAPTTSLPSSSTVSAATTTSEAPRSAETLAFADRIAYAEDDEGRALFTTNGVGYQSLVWAGGGETLTGAGPIQWWRPLGPSETFTTKAALPVAVEVRPDDPTSNFFTEVTISNVDADANVGLTFRAGGVDYTTGTTVPAGRSVGLGNVVRSLRELGAAIPAGAAAGTLTATFTNGAGRLSARVYTKFPDGATTGSGYGSLDPSAELFTYRKSLNGLKNTAAFRTNVAVANLCGADGACGTLSVTADFYDDATGDRVGGATLTVPPREWRQLDAPLAGLGATGETFTVLFTPVTASVAGYDAYATIVDNATQDSAFVRATPVGGSSNLTLPVVVDAQGIGTRFTSECSITNTTAVPAIADVTFTSTATGSTVHEVLNLGVGRGVRYANAVDHFRQLDPSKVAANDSGPLRVALRDFASGFVSSRTTASNGMGLGFTAIDPYLARAQRKKRVVGLKQTAAFRTNLAVVHSGATTNDPAAPITITVTVLDANGAQVGSPLTTTLLPGRLQQWNQLLSANFGVQGEGYTAVVERTAGQDAFDAYATVIDNLSSDPTFVRGE